MSAAAVLMVLNVSPPVVGSIHGGSDLRVEKVGLLAHDAITESSGLAASRRTPGMLWTHNDSGDSPRLFAVDSRGGHVLQAMVKGAKAKDWEDLAAFEWGGRAYLLAADTGDNGARRKRSTLYIVAEPSLNGPFPDIVLNLPVAWKIEFQFADGPRNCEAVAVDTAAGEVLLVSKTDLPPRLYTLPLFPANDELLVATRRALLTGIPRPTATDLSEDPVYGANRSHVTALDIDPANRQALVVTYKDAYLFGRAPGQSWSQALSGRPFEILLPPRRQGESGCFSADGRSIILGTEGRPSTLWRIFLSPGR